MSREISLREKKFAKTKLAIMDEFMRQLKVSRFDDISIQSVCATVEISEGTFFNYFPCKFDVLIYSLDLKGIYRSWCIDQKKSGKSILFQIDLFFEIIAKEFEEQHVVYEMLSAMIRERFQKKHMEISAAEKCFAFPDCLGMEDVTECAPDEYFTTVITDAQQAGEIPADADVGEIVMMLMSLLCGSVLAVPEARFSNVHYYMKKQLAYLWRGIGRVGYEKD